MVLSGGRLAKETNNEGGVKDFTVTPITDEDDKIHNAQDVNVVNSNDIEVKMTGEGLAQDETLTSGDAKFQIVNEDSIPVNQGALDKDTDDISTYKAHSIVKIIDNATITQTNTPADIDFSQYNNFVVTYNLGAGAGGTPTLTITLRFKDSNGNVIADADYATSALAASSSGIAFKGYMESYGTIQVLCTLGGTGTFAASTVAIEMKT